MEGQSTPLDTSNDQTASWHPPTPITPPSPTLSNISSTLPLRPSTPVPTTRDDAFDQSFVDESSSAYLDGDTGSPHPSASPQPTFDTQSLTREDSVVVPAGTSTQIDFRGLDYITVVDENLVCPVCRTPFVEPVTTSCDHVFCRECFDQAYQIAPICPIDRTRLRPPNHVGPTARIINNQLDALEVKCPNSAEGCGKILARSMAQNHVDRYCDYSLVDCPERTCERKVLRKDVHRGCLHWLAICPDCSESLFEVDMEHHRARNCTERKTNCEKCGFEMLRFQADLHEHECEEAIAHCRWAIYGCAHQSKRKDLALHAPECTFKIMGPVVESLKDEITTMRGEVQSLTERDKAKDRRIRFLESYKNAPSYGDSLTDMSNMPDHIPSSTDSAPYDSRDQYLLSLLENQESKVDRLSVGMTELEAKQTVMLFNETIPIKEQLAELRSAQGVIGCHVRWLMNLRLQERRPGAASALSGGAKAESSSASGSAGPGLQPRRLSDSRENITKL